MFRKLYYIGFTVKKRNTGNMYKAVLVKCKGSELNKIVSKWLGKYEEEYTDGAYVHAINRL